MTPLTDLFSGDSREEDGAPRESGAAVERAAQLRRGTQAAAASLPDEHEALGRRAVEAARAAEGAVERSDPGRRPPILEALQRMHFLVVGMGVGPEETPVSVVEEAVEALADAAGGASGA